MGIDLVDDRESRAPALEAGESILYRALGKGLSFKLTMGNVLTQYPNQNWSIRGLALDPMTGNLWLQSSGGNRGDIVEVDLASGLETGKRIIRHKPGSLVARCLVLSRLAWCSFYPLPLFSMSFLCKNTGFLIPRRKYNAICSLPAVIL